MITNFLFITAEEAPVRPTPEVKWRAQSSRPMRQVANLGPAAALPRRNVPRLDISVENDQVQDEENEQAA